MHTRLTNIGKATGYQLSPYDLYYSGFLNYVANKTDIETCLQLALSDKGEGYPILCGYADEWLFAGARDKLRGLLRNTALAMKDYYA